LKIYISQGSVAMQLRCGGIFSNHFITNFSTKYASEKLNIGLHGDDMDKSSKLTFLGPLCRPKRTQWHFIHDIFSRS